MKTTVLIVSSLMILGACSENQLSDAPVTAKAIRFESGIQTKAPVTGAQFGSGTKVGVYTLENTSSTPTWTAETSHASNNLIMNNIACTTNGNGGLTYEPVQSYKDNAKYSFFAYYPYTAAVTAPSTGTSPVLACTFSTTPADQEDYMYATPLESQTPSDNAKLLKFNHALTQITVKVVNGTNDELTLNTLKVHAPAGATMNIGNGEWTSATASTAYNLYVPTTGDKIAAGGTFSIPGQLMLLPVAAGGTAYTFDMNVTEGSSSSAIAKDNQTLTLPSDGMKAGYSYEYTITYGASSIQLSTSVVEWQHVTGPGITVK